MDVIGKKVVIKAWGRLGTKDGILYEEKGQLKFTDGFHDKKLTEEITGKIIPNGDGILEKTYKRMRGARNWHPLVKELRRTIDEKELGVRKLNREKNRTEEAIYVCHVLRTVQTGNRDGRKFIVRSVGTTAGRDRKMLERFIIANLMERAVRCVL